MSDFRTASRYAKALLDLAEEQKSLDKVYSDMTMVQRTIAASREFSLMLKSPIVKDSVKEVILERLFDGKVQKLSLEFMKLVSRKARAALLDPISKQALSQYLDRKGIQEAHLTTTFEIDDKLLKAFNDVVKDLTKKEPSISTRVSEDIIGGFVLDIGDKRIDTSIKSNLEKIEFELTH